MLLSRMLVVSVSALATLAVAEVVCRWRVHRANQRTLRAAFSEPSTVGRGEEASFRDIVRPSLDHRIAFELRPDLDVTFEGEPLETNAQGFRSPPLDVGPAAGVTILGIGDSFMFGHGVGNGESYMGQLRRLFEEAHPEVSWRASRRRGSTRATPGAG